MTMLPDDAAALIFRIAGALSFCQLPAMVLAPRMLRWNQELAAVSPLSRRIIGVIGIAIVLVVQGTAVVTLVGAAEMARGTSLGTAFAGFLGVFWGFRAAAQRTYAPLWPRGRVGWLSHVGLTCLFTTQSAVFLFGFVRGLVR
jgi:hypothetical protein